MWTHLGITPGPSSSFWKGKPVKGQLYPSRLKIFKRTGQWASLAHRVNSLTNSFNGDCCLLITASTKSSLISRKRLISGVGGVDTWGVFSPRGFGAKPQELSRSQPTDANDILAMRRWCRYSVARSRTGLRSALSVSVSRLRRNAKISCAHSSAPSSDCNVTTGITIGGMVSLENEGLQGGGGFYPSGSCPKPL